MNIILHIFFYYFLYCLIFSLLLLVPIGILSIKSNVSIINPLTKAYLIIIPLFLGGAILFMNLIRFFGFNI